MNTEESSRLAEYQRILITSMNDNTIPYLITLDTNQLLALSLQLSLISPIVNNLEHSKQHIELHKLIGLGCAALQLLAITQLNATTESIINAKD